MLFLLIVKNISFILYIFGFLILILSKFDTKKIIYLVILIAYSFLDPSIVYCESIQEQSDKTEKILSAVLAEDDSAEIDFNTANKKSYYILAISITLVLAFGLYYYFNYGGGDLSIPSSNLLNQNPFEESEVKFSEDSLTKRLDFNTTPQTTPEKALDRYTSDISPEYEKGIRILTDL